MLPLISPEAFITFSFIFARPQSWGFFFAVMALGKICLFRLLLRRGNQPRNHLKALFFIMIFLAVSSLVAQDRLPDKLPATPAIPSIDKYMLVKENDKFIPAYWLGTKYKGKTIQEPINIIILDSVSKTEIEAKNKLLNACKDAGFPQRKGHSSGYFAMIDGKVIAQFEQKESYAFSDAASEFNNDHGRIFGPYIFQGKYYYVAAFSREEVTPLKKVRHQYNSFNHARDRFSELMDEKTSYKKVRFVNLDNAIIGPSKFTTGDHDGIAVMLELK